MNFINKMIEQYALDHTSTSGEDALLKRLESEAYRELNISQVMTGRLEARFLKLLARLIGARRILEIGAFGGYSTLSMAEALPDDGTLVTHETMVPHESAFAIRCFEDSLLHGKKITQQCGPLQDVIKTLLEAMKTETDQFDMAFINANKQLYKDIFPLIRKGGLIVVDNVLSSGQVLNPKNDSDKAIHQFNEGVINDDRVESVLLTVRNGLSCIIKN